jgi:hypothetical protein
MPPAPGLNDVKGTTVKGVDRFALIGHGVHSALGGTQFVAEPGIDKDSPGLSSPVFLDHEAARQHAKRTLENAHCLIRDETMYSGILHQALRIREKNGVIGADKFVHGY